MLQKGRPLLLHRQNVGRELEKLTKTGHLEKVNSVDEECFAPQGVINGKSDKFGENCTRTKVTVA